VGRLVVLLLLPPLLLVLETRLSQQLHEVSKPATRRLCVFERGEDTHTSL
jgi:hypothetical protein